MDLYYCGFNGFKQCPSSADCHTLTTLTAHTKNAKKITDVAICWNYLAVAQDGAITKYGLINGKHGSERLTLPQGCGGIKQLSATPRHLLVTTETGECWTHDESRGWRRVQVGLGGGQQASTPEPISPAKDPPPPSEDSPEGVAESEVVITLLDVDAATAPAPPPPPPQPPHEQQAKSESDANESEKAASSSSLAEPPSSPAHMVKTSCGDAHNIGLDRLGQAYSLPVPIDFDTIGGEKHKVIDVVCGKEHCLLLTEHGQVYSWGGGSRGQLGHGSLNGEERPRLITALDGMRIRKIAAGGWHSAVISQYDDLYMFGWNESGQLAQLTNLAKPAECFSAVEKLLMACCTMQPEDAAAGPRGDTEDGEVYHKPDEESLNGCGGVGGGGAALSSGGPLDRFCLGDGFGMPIDPEKDALTCYTSASCNAERPDIVMVQSLPMLVTIPGKNGADCHVTDVSCGSRHTVVLTEDNSICSFGWNKYGQLGLGHTASRDAAEKLVRLPKALASAGGKNGGRVQMLRCGDWGTAIAVQRHQPADNSAAAAAAPK